MKNDKEDDSCRFLGLIIYSNICFLCILLNLPRLFSVSDPKVRERLLYHQSRDSKVILCIFGMTHDLFSPCTFMFYCVGSSTVNSIHPSDLRQGQVVRTSLRGEGLKSPQSPLAHFSTLRVLEMVIARVEYVTVTSVTTLLISFRERRSVSPSKDFSGSSLRLHNGPESESPLFPVERRGNPYLPPIHPWDLKVKVEL